MRHQRKTIKLGRKEGHRKSLLSNLAVSLIAHNRIKTTLAKAKALRPLAEKLVTIGKKNTIHARRTAKAVLRQDEAVTKLFAEIAPRAADRKGGYTRIIKLGPRQSDSAPVAFLEWVDYVVEAEKAPAEATDKPAKADKGEKAEKPAKAPKPKKEKAEKAEKTEDKE